MVFWRDGSWLVDCTDSGLTSGGSLACAEFDLYKPAGDRPAGGDSVVCGVVFGFGRQFYANFLYRKNVLAPACHRRKSAALFMAAGDAARGLGVGAAMSELVAPTRCA